MEQNKAGPQTAEWWVKRIADPCIRDRIMANDYYRKNKTNKHDSLCWALNDVVSGDEIPDIRAKYFSPDHTTASHTDWVKEEAKLLPVGQQGYTAGDYVVVTNNQNGDPVGTLSQIVRSNGPENWKIIKYPNGTQEWSASECSIRPATEKEIAQAQGTPLPTEKEWVPKVGDWMWTDVQRYASRGKAIQIVNISKDHPERLVIGNGGWFDKKDARPATPEEIRKAQSKNGKEWICTSEDGVELYNGDSPVWVNVGAKEIHSPCELRKDHVGTSIGEGMPYKVFSTEQAAKEWIALQSTFQVPVTADNAYVGMKVVMTDEVRKRGGDKEVYIGEIIDWYGTVGVSVKWPIGSKAGKNYTWGNLYIAPEEKSTSKSIINSQTKTKTNSYEHKEHNKQQDSIYSAIYVCTDYQVISKPERRTATPVSGGGCPGLTQRAYKVNRKAISCL